MDKIDVAGLNVDAISKREFLDAALKRIQNGQKTFVITPYSEFLFAGLKDPALFGIFNKADFSLADGIGIFWAKRYLSIPLTAKSYWGKIFQALWQLKYSLAAIVFYPRWIKSSLPEKIVGADLIWDLARLAADNNLSIYLLGGFGDTTQVVAQKLHTYITDGRQFNKYVPKILYSNKNPGDPTVIGDINAAAPDLLFVAYGPIKQEQWIAENLGKLNIKLAIGLGGTFDYIAGRRHSPPKFLRYSGLEWLWRLLTQPGRYQRIINATYGLARGLWHYKVFMSYPYRANVVSIILNQENKILVCQRNPNNPEDKLFGFQKKDMLNYWQFPQGGIDSGESIEQTVARECKEELGLVNLSILKISAKKHTYLYPNALRPLFARQSKYKGQEQSIAYLKFSGKDSDIKVDNIEFVKFKWVKSENLSSEVHEHRKAVAKIVLEDLKNLA